MTATAGLRELAAEFPVLSRRIDGRPVTYLDSAATSQTPQPPWPRSLTGRRTNL